MRVPADLHARIKEIADANDRTLIWVLRNMIESDSKSPVRVSECPSAALERIPAPLPSNAIAVTTNARRLVLDNVPRHLLSNTRTRTGLEEQVQQMIVDGCDPRGIVLALQEWVNRPDAYPGHLPHIYTELLRQRTAKPKRSKVDDKVLGWLELGEKMEREGR